MALTDETHGDAPPDRSDPVPVTAPPVVLRPPARELPALVWHCVALSVAVALVAGGLAGAITARLTPRPVAVGASETATVPPEPSSTVPRPEAPDVPTVIANVGRSVVAIDVTMPSSRARSGRQTAGTGFVLTSDGMIATNAHVVKGASSLTVTLSDGLPLPARLVGLDDAADLAVVHVDRTTLVPLPLGASDALRVGETVIAVGQALALEGGPTATMGIVSALDRSITITNGGTYAHLIQTDAAINPGDSGGPLVDRAGRVVGINTAGSSTAENVGFAIGIDEARPVLDRLRALFT